MNNSIAIFSNSIAGNGQAQFKENIITQTLQQANISYTIAPNTSKVASIAWLKSNEAKVKTFIVIGGDGTFNLVINNIEDISSKRFLFIASGTANILANEYDLNPKDILARLAAKSNAIHPAIIKTNNKQTYSLMFTSVGFDADIIATTQRSRNKISSKLKFILPILKRLINNKRPQYLVRINDKPVGEFEWIIFIQTRTYASKFFKVYGKKQAKKWRLILVKKASLRKIFIITMAALTKGITESKNVETVEANRISIYPKHKGSSLQIDGDYAPEIPCEIITSKKTLNLINKNLD